MHEGELKKMERSLDLSVFMYFVCACVCGREHEWPLVVFFKVMIIVR